MKLLLITFSLFSLPLPGGEWWVKTYNHTIPSRAAKAGWEANGDPLYICGGGINRGFHPGKIRPGFGGCNISQKGAEIKQTDYHIFTGPLKWAKASYGTHPKYAYMGGYLFDKRPLYICRGKFKGGMHPGKLNPAQEGCSIGWGGKEHILSNYEVLIYPPKSNTGPKPTTDPTPLKTTQEPSSVRGITEEHNKIRRRLNLPDLQWSPKLATVAQQWANYLAKNYGCNMRHRSQVPGYAKPYGENLYWSSALRWSNGRREVAKRTAYDAVKSWGDEAVDYNYATNSCRRGKVCGHYTQVVWKKSRSVGCGMAVCSDKTQVWVCNYDPPGNYRGKRPY